jgi:hypothetical protein
MLPEETKIEEFFMTKDIHSPEDVHPKGVIGHADDGKVRVA